MQWQEFYCGNTICPVPPSAGWMDVICHDSSEILGQPGTCAFERNRADASTFVAVPFRLFPHYTKCWLKPPIVLNKTCNNPFKI